MNNFTYYKNVALALLAYTAITMAGIVMFYHVINGGFLSQPSLHCETSGGQVQCVPVDSAY